jgi:NAD(P)H dehydrogenase (quinone)
LFRNNLYMDLVPLMFGGALATGTLAHNGGDGRIGFIAREDIAAALAPCSPPRVTRAARTPSRRPGPTVSLSGGGSWARPAARASFTKPSRRSEFRTRLSATPIPPAIVDNDVALGEAMRAGEFDAESNDARDCWEREPVTLDAFLAHARDTK